MIESTLRQGSQASLKWPIILFLMISDLWICCNRTLPRLLSTAEVRSSTFKLICCLWQTLVLFKTYLTYNTFQSKWNVCGKTYWRFAHCCLPWKRDVSRHDLSLQQWCQGSDILQPRMARGQICLQQENQCWSSRCGVCLQSSPGASRSCLCKSSWDQGGP